jgi:glycerophosphoryl diester phosphodiesterase
METLREFGKATELFVTAHRGASGRAPENTLPAFRNAIEAGAKMVEADVQITSDGRIVAFHDDELDRTTNGSGRVADRTYEEISDMDAGSWFDEKFAGTRVPLLEEVIEMIKGKIYLNIEIKSYPRGNVTEDLESIIDCVESAGYGEYTLFSSFDYRLLTELKRIRASMPTAAIMHPGEKRLISEIAAEIGCEAFVCSIAQINEEIAEDAEKNGILTGVYPVDTSMQLDLALRFGVKTIVTNFPELIIDELIKIGKMIK